MMLGAVWELSPPPASCPQQGLQSPGGTECAASEKAAASPRRCWCPQEEMGPILPGSCRRGSVLTPAPGSSSLVVEGSKDPRLPTPSHSSWSLCYHPGTLQRQEQAGELCCEQSVAGLRSFSASAFGNGLSTMAGHPDSLPLPVPWGLLWQPPLGQGMLRAGAGPGAVLGCGAPNLLRGGIAMGRSAWGQRPAGAVSLAQRRGH